VAQDAERHPAPSLHSQIPIRDRLFYRGRVGHRCEVSAAVEQPASIFVVENSVVVLTDSRACVAQQYNVYSLLVPAFAGE